MTQQGASVKYFRIEVDFCAYIDLDAPDQGVMAAGYEQKQKERVSRLAHQLIIKLEPYHFLIMA